MNHKLSMEALGRLDPIEYKSIKKNNCLVILDNIRSMSNVGSIFRTCDAFNVSKLYLGGITPTPPHREIEKTALGSTNSVVWEHFEDTKKLIKKLKSESWVIVSIEQTNNKVWLQDFDAKKYKKIAFVMGNEVMGVDEKIIEMSDLVVEIPQWGTKHSLNVAVTTGIVLWDYVSKNIDSINQ